jgi:uncharacterized protein (DUF1499 family)
MRSIGTFLLLALTLAALVVGAGQLGLFSGQTPDGLGVREARLKAPAQTPNSVSSQAGLYAGHPQRSYADIAPFAYTGDGQAALRRLAVLLQSSDRCLLVTQSPDYLYAQCSTRWLKFTDDVEFYLDAPTGVIHVRSASRIGHGDLGVNRARVEALRARFAEAGKTLEVVRKQ